MSISDNPFPYYEYLRAKGPATRLPHRNVVAVTGYREAIEIYRDVENYSNINDTAGPLTPLGFAPEGDDIGEQLRQHRATIPMADRLIHLDREDHARQRSLLNALFTPSRLRENEHVIRQLTDRLIGGFMARGEFELIKEFGQPLSGMVIADLLGVPESDKDWFEACFSGRLPTIEGEQLHHDLFHAVAPKFAEYLEDRRINPRDDVVTELARARFPDGSLPTVDELSMLAAFLFTAGQDTTARLLGAALQVLAENDDLQQRLRADPALIPDFVEEVLRFDGPVKTSNRLVIRTTTLAGVTLKAGTTVSLLNGAINRDPERFESPNEFRLGRAKAREHVAFGRGPHTCIGAPLARKETIIAVGKLLERLGRIRISDAKHGPPGERAFHHEPHYILRGLQALHLSFTPA
jgi:cytochrome P450